MMLYCNNKDILSGNKHSKNGPKTTTSGTKFQENKSKTKQKTKIESFTSSRVSKLFK